jgi:hypothetical protein
VATKKRFLASLKSVKFLDLWSQATSKEDDEAEALQQHQGRWIIPILLVQTTVERDRWESLVAKNSGEGLGTLHALDENDDLKEMVS